MVPVAGLTSRVGSVAPKSAFDGLAAGTLDQWMTNTMIKILLALLLSLMTGAASAQQQTLYDTNGKVVGRSATDAAGTVTTYDAKGNVIIRESTKGNTTTIYDASGRNVGHYSANPK